MFDATSCYNLDIFPGTRPWTANVPVKRWVEVLGPLTILPLYDIQIGKPMTVSRMMTPSDQMSIDHSQSLRWMFSWAAMESLYPTIFIILKSTKSRISGGRYSGVVTWTSLLTVLKPKLVPKSIILTEQTICFLKSKLISIFSDFKSQWTRLIYLRRLRPRRTRRIIFLNYLQLSCSRILHTLSS